MMTYVSELTGDSRVLSAPMGCYTGTALGEHQMSDQSSSDGDIPIMQQLLDSPFLLLFIGVVVPTVFYIIWGVMEVVSIPVAP